MRESPDGWRANPSLHSWQCTPYCHDVSTTAIAAEKPPLTDGELKALRGKGLSISSSDVQGGKVFTAQITYAPGGTLSGTLTFVGRPPTAMTGTWKIDGGRFCRTVVPLQTQEVCETWLKSGEKEVTIRVGDVDIAVSRWE